MQSFLAAKPHTEKQAEKVCRAEGQQVPFMSRILKKTVSLRVEHDHFFSVEFHPSGVEAKGYINEERYKAGEVGIQMMGERAHSGIQSLAEGMPKPPVIQPYKSSQSEAVSCMLLARLSLH